jgi:hypothetical protein
MDQGCLCRISDPNFFHPGSGVKKISGKDFKYTNPKNCSKLSEIWSEMFIPDPDLDFTLLESRIPDPGVKRQPNIKVYHEEFLNLNLVVEQFLKK